MADTFPEHMDIFRKDIVRYVTNARRARRSNYAHIAIADRNVMTILDSPLRATWSWRLNRSWNDGRDDYHE